MFLASFSLASLLFFSAVFKALSSFFCLTGLTGALSFDKSVPYWHENHVSQPLLPLGLSATINDMSGSHVPFLFAAVAVVAQIVFGTQASPRV